ncbi:MAG: hypothetical protein HY344_02645 [Candidatus Levybacteria bacterium]|nr:hypothetical protein [Candidatus Levybacteria bacterium]
MKTKHFYSHLVETTHITLELASLDVTSEERVHLLSLVEANIHSTVVSKTLSQLSEEDKKTFLKNLALENHEQTLSHLKTKVNDIEEKLKKEIDRVTKELLEDVKKVKENQDKK